METKIHEHLNSDYPEYILNLGLHKMWNLYFIHFFNVNISTYLLIIFFYITNLFHHYLYTINLFLKFTNCIANTVLKITYCSRFPSSFILLGRNFRKEENSFLLHGFLMYHLFVFYLFFLKKSVIFFWVIF